MNLQLMQMKAAKKAKVPGFGFGFGKSTWFWFVKKRPAPPAEKLMVLKMRVDAVEAGLIFMMRGDSVSVRRVGSERAFTFPSDVKERRRGEHLSLPHSTALATTTEELSGKAWVAISL